MHKLIRILDEQKQHEGGLYLKVAIIIVVLIAVCFLALSVYYVIAYNQLWETDGSVTVLRLDTINKINERWDYFVNSVIRNTDVFNTEERALEKMVEDYKPLTKKSALKDIVNAEYYYREAMDHYLTLVENDTKLKRSSPFNKAMGDINAIEEDINILKKEYNNAVFKHNKHFDSSIKSYLAEMNDFEKYEEMQEEG